MSLWFEIAATVPPGLVEPVAELLRELSTGGVSVEEPVDILGPEQGFTVRTGEPVVVRAYLPSGELGAVLVDDLRRRMEPFPGVELVARPVYDEDWSTSWRDFFGAVETGGRVVVVPTWVDYDTSPASVVVRIDPGQAFGTGHHETTRLCLLALEERVWPGCDFLDLGSGSGILSVAAILLGAGRGMALDIDPATTQVAAANLALNGIQAGRVAVAAGTLEEGHGATYDLVVANVFADPLIRLAARFAEVVRPGGVLILGGILGVDAGRVGGALVATGFAPAGRRNERDWCALEFTRLPDGHPPEHG